MHALNERTFTVTYQCQWPLQSPSQRTMNIIEEWTGSMPYRTTYKPDEYFRQLAE